MKKEVFVVEKHTGTLEGYTKPVCCFLSEEKAKEYADKLNDELASVFAKCDNDVEDNAIYNIRLLSDKYIEENYPDIWKDMNDESYNDNDLLWSQISDIEYEFEKETDDVVEYAREKVNDGLLTEKDVEDIINFYAYNATLETDDCQPFYSVSKGVLIADLED